jgi:large subunit ribosomal protein L1
VSFSAADLTKNVVAVLDELNRVKPASAKGRYVLSVTLSSTMGPGVKIDPSRTHDEELVSAS